LANATRLCEANFGVLLLHESAQFRVAAAHNPPPAYAELRRRQPEIRSSGVLARSRATKQLLHITDCTKHPSYKQGDDDFVAFVDLCGVRTLLDAPLLKKGELIGIIALYRQEVHRFTDQQVELVKNFAAQAVIAIENARLLNELRQSLEQQTATSEVLQVISSSPDDLQPVFATLLENAVRLCGANFGNLFLYENDGYRAVAMHNAPESYANIRRGVAFQPPLGSGLGRLMATKEVVQIADLMLEDIYKKGDPLAVTGVTHAGIRTLLAVPMLKEDHLVGAIVIYRQEVRPFTDKQIALVTNFAVQAVIAIENARLLNELRQRTNDLTEALEQQTATSEVLQVISSSPGELEPVFAAMLASATRICEAKFSLITLFASSSSHCQRRSICRDATRFHQARAERQSFPSASRLALPRLGLAQ
jgi:GAF domain-containing protein